MSIRLPPRRHRAATLLALLLLVLRLAVPTHAMSAGTTGSDAALAQVLGEAPICHADAGPTAPEPAGPALPSAHDCALCPTCQLAAPALLPAASSWTSAPSLSGPMEAALPPPATGPPQPERRATPPRGPPASAV
jgi:hypothetical protein